MLVTIEEVQSHFQDKFVPDLTNNGIQATSSQYQVSPIVYLDQPARDLLKDLLNSGK